MNPKDFDCKKWLLYPALFAVGLLSVFLGLTFVLTLCSFFLWVIIPSIVIRLVGTLLPLAVFVLLIFLSTRKKLIWLKSISWGATIGVCMIVVLGAVSLFFKPEQKPNQKQSLSSPSGKYVLTVPIERGDFQTSSGPKRWPLWQVTISAPEGNVLYKDQDSQFLGNFNVYWCWDQNDRVWLYNSDDGQVCFWEYNGKEWTKTKWGHGKTKNIDGDFTPPVQMYPHYVK